MAIVVSCVCIVGVGFAADEDPILEFGLSDRLYKTLRLSDLKATLAVVQLDFMDPQHGKQKRYEAFKFQDVLDVAFGDQWRTGD
jgi:hypothetical protein